MKIREILVEHPMAFIKALYDYLTKNNGDITNAKDVIDASEATGLRPLLARDEIQDVINKLEAYARTARYNQKDGIPPQQQIKKLDPRIGWGNTASRADAESNENKLLQRLVLAEARGEGLVGMALVARATMNRWKLLNLSGQPNNTFKLANEKESSLANVIFASGQFQPVSDGSINTNWTDDQYKAAAQAVRLGNAPEMLAARLKSLGYSKIDIAKLLNATGFRTGDAFNDPSQNVNVVKFKGHVFNTAGNDSFNAKNLAEPESIPQIPQVRPQALNRN